MKYLFAVVALIIGISGASALDPRKQGSCQDACGKKFAAKTMTPDKSMILSDCNNFLASTVSGPASTVTTTIPLPVFASQTLSELMQPTFTGTQTTSHAGPTHAPIPEYINGLGCHCGGAKVGAELYTSLCKCAGAKQTTTTVPASTVTVAVHIPTQVAQFKIRVVFENGTFLYLRPAAYNVAGGEWVGSVTPESSNNTSTRGSDFMLSNGTLLYKPLKLMEYERVLPSLADGTPQLVWFASQKEDRMDHSRPFEVKHEYKNNMIVHRLIPQEGGAGIDYTEFFVCESCGNQLYISTTAWKDGYMRRMATDKYDRYDWVELQAEPDFTT